MKAIIQAYSPKEIERIARGEQTIKVCKTAPKDTPFKVYMYKKPYAGGIKILDKVLLPSGKIRYVLRAGK